MKALETPTDLALTPKGSESGDDVGASVKVPEEPYPQGVQAKLDDDGKGTTNDQSKLSIQGAIGKSELVQKSNTHLLQKLQDQTQPWKQWINLHLTSVQY